MLLQTPEVNMAMFHYHPEDKTFTQEISTLGRDFQLGQVYDDACDEGFTMVSHHTGKHVAFAQCSVDKDREGDIAGWWYESVTPGHKGFRCLVIND